MRAYIVSATVPVEDTDKKLRRFAGSQSDAAAEKRKLLDEFDVLKRNDVRVDETEIPTNKVGLIDWLNKNVDAD